LSRIHRIVMLACVCVAMVLGTEAATAQSKTVEQVIFGRLIDDASHQPVANGTIRLLNTDSASVLSVVTDSLGRFRIATRYTGAYMLRAEHIAYKTSTSAVIVLALRDTLRLDFHVLPSAVLLSPIVVTGQRTLAPYYAARGMDDFYRRMMTMERALSGQFMTRDSIANWEGSTITSMLMTFRGLDVRSSSEILMRNCRPRIYAEGVEYQLQPGETLEDAFPPHRLEAIEVYIGQNVPGDFFGRSCGVIVFWRRR
jgi:hypothetical protein